ncbi:hexaprenyldihydroxybenzoate methyltransferase [Mytilinidion resinicola]|uniref:Ubiquinone biosynthesis O-methyltransferase, mitochondrial n=1 Tax=Mytilinidion resinicola TaxID=574789 RepID=A0A6A6YTD4_9PEZI|nr:hexaprenyldihydroxybenzoate methyltransferase [Mytilinidion resinicola]KAF2812070.1 hexaprenyldihydroxybenzoate methyltransferase [Mytilinidion resinicola]
MPSPRLLNPLRALSKLPRTSTTSALRTPTHPRPSQQPVLPPRFRHDSTRYSSTSSVDPTEVSHFNALASSWWDPHGPFRLLHLMNPLRHTFITRCLASVPSPTSNSHPTTYRYLDVGCGGGIFAESAARLPHTSSVTAIDPSSEVLAIAEAHKNRDPILMSTGKLTYRNEGIEALPLPKTEAEQFDIVTLFEVLEHVNSPSEFLGKLMPHVKPGGWLVLSTIARTWTSWAVTNVMAEDVLGIVPKGTHDWRKYVNEGEVREWFEKREGWGEMRTIGCVYVPGLGWREVPGGEGWGNYFFGVRREG